MYFNKLYQGGFKITIKILFTDELKTKCTWSFGFSKKLATGK